MCSPLSVRYRVVRELVEMTAMTTTTTTMMMMMVINIYHHSCQTETAAGYGLDLDGEGASAEALPASTVDTTKNITLEAVIHVDNAEGTGALLRRPVHLLH